MREVCWRRGDRISCEAAAGWEANSFSCRGSVPYSEYCVKCFELLSSQGPAVPYQP